MPATLKHENWGRLEDGRLHRAEVHWYEAHGIGRKGMKIKRLLDRASPMSHETPPHFGVCIRNQGCEDFQLLKLYPILPDQTAESAGLLRVADDSGEDYLYPA